MAARTSPATIVICAALTPRSAAAARRSGGVPLTWVAGIDALERLGHEIPSANLALAIEPAWLESRKALRAALVQARHAVPGLEAVVVRGTPLAHHAILAEEGIRVAVVDAFTDVGRGSRRPAPTGWPCRNVAWGLWEVLASPPRRSPAWAWLPGLPAPRRGGVHVAMADAGSTTLARLVDWADRGIARGRASGVGLADLAAVIEGSRSAPLAASVLKAA